MPQPSLQDLLNTSNISAHRAHISRAAFMGCFPELWNAMKGVLQKSDGIFSLEDADHALSKLSDSEVSRLLSKAVSSSAGSQGEGLASLRNLEKYGRDGGGGI